MKKRINIVFSLLLAGSLMCSVPSLAVFNAGLKTKSFTYSGKKGSISVMADVDTNTGGTYYKYKGDIYYPSKSKLSTFVQGYYSSNGKKYPITNEKTETSSKTATVYAYVPDKKVGVCTSSKPCYSDGTVKSSDVGRVKYPS